MSEAPPEGGGPAAGSPDPQPAPAPRRGGLAKACGCVSLVVLVALVVGGAAAYQWLQDRLGWMSEPAPPDLARIVEDLESAATAEEREEREAELREALGRLKDAGDERGLSEPSRELIRIAEEALERTESGDLPGGPEPAPSAEGEASPSPGGEGGAGPEPAREPAPGEVPEVGQWVILARTHTPSGASEPRTDYTYKWVAAVGEDEVTIALQDLDADRERALGPPLETFALRGPPPATAGEAAAVAGGGQATLETIEVGGVELPCARIESRGPRRTRIVTWTSGAIPVFFELYGFVRRVTLSRRGKELERWELVAFGETGGAAKPFDE